MKWLWRLSLKKRIIIAVVVLPAIHSAFYTVPRWAATHPRFDKKAWQQATDLLKEEVGAQAIENGIFSIPKIPVSTPYRGRVIGIQGYFSPHPDMFMSKEKDNSYFLLRRVKQARHFAESFSRMRAARITDDEAGRIWNVFAYLRAVEVAGGPQEMLVLPEKWYYDRNPEELRYLDRTKTDKTMRLIPLVKHKSLSGLTLIDATWPRTRVATLDDQGRIWTPLPAAVTAECTSRFIVRLSESDDLAWSHGDKIAVKTLVKSLRASTPPESENDVEWADICVNQLALIPGTDSLAAFQRIAKLQLGRAKSERRLALRAALTGLTQAQRSALRRKLAELPVIGRLFRSRSASAPQYRLPSVEVPLPLAEKLAGEPPTRYAEILSAIATALPRDHVMRIAALKALHHNWPGRAVNAACADFDRMNQALRLLYVSRYEELFGKDERVAHLGADDASPQVRAWAHYQLYRLTTDETHLARLMDLAEQRRENSRSATERLRALCGEGSRPVDIATFFRKHFSAGNAMWLIPLLGKTGARENLDFLLSLALCGEDSAASPEDWRGPMYYRAEAAAALLAAGDAQAVDALIDYVESGPPAGEEYLRDTIIFHLPQTARPNALQTLEHLLALVQENPTALPARNKEIRRYPPSLARCPEDPVEFLARAVAELGCRCAKNPLDFEFPAPAWREEREQNIEIRVDTIATTYTIQELEAFLADEKYAERRGEVYAALIRKRRGDQ